MEMSKEVCGVCGSDVVRIGEYILPYCLKCKVHISEDVVKRQAIYEEDDDCRRITPSDRNLMDTGYKIVPVLETLTTKMEELSHKIIDAERCFVDAVRLLQELTLLARDQHQNITKIIYGEEE